MAEYISTPDAERWVWLSHGLDPLDSSIEQDIGDASHDTLRRLAIRLTATTQDNTINVTGSDDGTLRTAMREAARRLAQAFESPNIDSMSVDEIRTWLRGKIGARAGERLPR